jgi:hypothetical protein
MDRFRQILPNHFPADIAAPTTVPPTKAGKPIMRLMALASLDFSGFERAPAA